MSHKLDQILISYDQPNFLERLVNVFLSKGGMSHFGFGPKHVENRRKVEDILSNVVERKDEAITQYTEKFDGVKLTPDQFRVQENELKKAHEKADPELLDSIRKAVANVKRYQKDIFVGKNKSFPNGTGIKILRKFSM